MPGVMSSLLLCFIISFDEFVLAFFLGGTDPTLPVFLFSQLRFPNKLPGTLALGSPSSSVSAVLVVAAEMLRRRGRPASRRAVCMSDQHQSSASRASRSISARSPRSTTSPSTSGAASSSRFWPFGLRQDHVLRMLAGFEHPTTARS